MTVPIPKMAFVKCQTCRWSDTFPIIETREAFFLKAAEAHHNASKGCEEELVVLPTATRKPKAGFTRGFWRLRMQPWNWHCSDKFISVTAKLEHFGLRGAVLVTEIWMEDRMQFTGFDSDSLAG